MSESIYEFTEAENRVLLPLSRKMTFVAVVLMITAAVHAVTGILASNWGVLLEAGVYVLIGIWTKKAANAFRRIVDTQGNDIPNLMTAMGQLNNLFTLIQWLLVILAIAILLLFGLTFVKLEVTMPA